MPYPDVAALIEDADARDAQAARDSENLAMLVDRTDFLNNFGYVSGITDPEDPDIKRERAERLKHGIKPPPMPILAPVAQRAPEISAELIERYREAQKPYQLPEKKPESKLAQLNRARAEAGR
ncbi:hypothetical protein GV794_01905 [Nocardia cyriacigeorgica]|uniref:Uncharacterized protein n=1 Tax=Nocardia cyriacigeorgica TaxID=135487 RepID=A0ABX0CF49_9NOCA|nr:hypothetical protein [Nocardia cyriacigeorgica]NEW40778.1 hypothetical protein [Nocardia cyriacigeorgica]NEW50996.1 hypothetical protein [Nocardia cyriacigeorgica]NEW54421.1 hypothetical protein [Nocardia cyriacigeorgica]